MCRVWCVIIYLIVRNTLVLLELMSTGSFVGAHRNSLAIFLSVNLFQILILQFLALENYRLACVNYTVAATMHIAICFRSRTFFYQHIQYLIQAIHFLKQML